MSSSTNATTEHQDQPDSDEEDKKFLLRKSAAFERFKRKCAVIVERFFESEARWTGFVGDLNDFDGRFIFFLVKKFIVVAMQRGDKEKEMAAYGLSRSYSNGLRQDEIYKGYKNLVETVDFLILDIPDAVGTLAIFIARAHVDDTLPLDFFKKMKAKFNKDSKSYEVVEKGEKIYTTTPPQTILEMWGGDLEIADNIKDKIREFLEDFVETENKLQAIRDVQDLKSDMYSHEVVKAAVIMSLERRETEIPLLALLKKLGKSGCIGLGEGHKGFDRVVDMVNEGMFDHIPKVRRFLKLMIHKAETDRWIDSNKIRPILPLPNEGGANSVAGRSERGDK